MKALVKTTMGLVPATLVAFGVMAGSAQAFAGSNAETVKQGALENNNKTASKLDNQSTTNSSEHQSSYEYTEVSMHESYVKDAEIDVYSVKDDNGLPAAVITNTYKNLGRFFPQFTGVSEYTATAKEGWVFKGWKYEQFIYGKERGNYGISFRSFSKDHDHKTTPYTSGNVISVNRTGGMGETAVLNKRIYKVYANLNPTITATAGVGGSITDAGTKEVQYGENKEYKFTANEGYVIDSLKIDGKEQTVEHVASSSYEFKAVKSPHKIEVSFAKVYTVTYTDGVEGEVIFKDQVTSGILSGTDTPKFIGTPSRTGYEFTGWSSTVADKVTADATYNAQWKRIQRTVTFKDGDKTPVTVKVETGRAIATDALIDQSMPQNPTKPGYTFKGWNTQKDGQGTAFTAKSVVNSDMTVYAIYTQDPVPTPAPKPQPKTPAPKTPDPKTPQPKPQPKTPAPKPKPKPQSATSAPETLAPKPQSPTLPKTPAPKSQPTTAAPKSAAFKPQTETSAPETSSPKLQPEILALKLRPETPAPKLQPEKHIGMLPKTGESASYAGVFVALGFLIAGLAIICKKNMLEENKK